MINTLSHIYNAVLACVFICLVALIAQAKSIPAEYSDIQARQWRTTHYMEALPLNGAVRKPEASDEWMDKFERLNP
jgi:hypothetical protein